MFVFQDFADKQIASVLDTKKALIRVEKNMFGNMVEIPLTVAENQAWVKSCLISPIVEKIIKHASQAVRRCDNLSGQVDLASNVECICMTLMSKINNDFLIPLLDTVLQLLPDSSLNPEGADIFVLNALKLVNIILEKLHRFYTKYVIPRVADNPNVKSVLEARKKDCIRAAEGKILQALVACQNAMLGFMREAISEQRSNYFKPRDESILLDAKPSPPCVKICETMSQHVQTAMNSLTGLNLDRYLTLLGMQMYKCIVQHLLKNFGAGINNTGATLLTLDVKEYQLVARQMYIPSVEEHFNHLRSITAFFHVPIESIKAVWESTQQQHQHVDAQMAAEFLKLRADFPSNKFQILSSLPNWS
jgi:hypothetical protein